MHSSVPIRRHRFEQARTQIHILISTPLTRIDNFSCGVGAGGRVDERDGFLAFGIGVGIGAIGHHGDGKGADGLTIGIGGATRAQTDLIMGNVASVGGNSC